MEKQLGTVLGDLESGAVVTVDYKGKPGFASSQDEAVEESCIPGLECAWQMQSIKEVKMFGAGESRVPRRTVDED